MGLDRGPETRDDMSNRPVYGTVMAILFAVGVVLSGQNSCRDRGYNGSRGPAMPDAGATSHNVAPPPGGIRSDIWTRAIAIVGGCGASRDDACYDKIPEVYNAMSSLTHDSLQ